LSVFDERLILFDMRHDLVVSLKSGKQKHSFSLEFPHCTRPDNSKTNKKCHNYNYFALLTVLVQAYRYREVIITHFGRLEKQQNL